MFRTDFGILILIYQLNLPLPVAYECPSNGPPSSVLRFSALVWNATDAHVPPAIFQFALGVPGTPEFLQWDTQLPVSRRRRWIGGWGSRRGLQSADIANKVSNPENRTFKWGLHWWQDAIAAVDSFEPPSFPPVLIVGLFLSPPLFLFRSIFSSKSHRHHTLPSGGSRRHSLGNWAQHQQQQQHHNSGAMGLGSPDEVPSMMAPRPPLLSPNKFRSGSHRRRGELTLTLAFPICSVCQGQSRIPMLIWVQ